MTATATSIVSPNVDRRIAEFLDTLKLQRRQPMEQLTPEEARCALVGMQKSSTFRCTSRTSPQDDHRRREASHAHDCPAGWREGHSPVFMFFHGGGWVLATSRPMNASSATW